MSFCFHLYCVSAFTAHLRICLEIPRGFWELIVIGCCFFLLCFPFWGFSFYFSFPHNCICWFSRATDVACILESVSRSRNAVSECCADETRRVIRRLLVQCPGGAKKLHPWARCLSDFSSKIPCCANWKSIRCVNQPGRECRVYKALDKAEVHRHIFSQR